MSTVAEFENILQHAQTCTYRRVDGGAPCPCRTPEGFRDPIWHRENPGEPFCDANGFLAGTVTTAEVRAFIQPIQSSRATRLEDEIRIQNLFAGEVYMDDHLGIFPIAYNGVTLNFRDWGRSGEDYIIFDGRRFTVVNANKWFDPISGDVPHHHEVGLRLIGEGEPDA